MLDVRRASSRRRRTWKIEDRRSSRACLIRHLAPSIFSSRQRDTHLPHPPHPGTISLSFIRGATARAGRHRPELSNMRLTDILKPENIKVPLQATTKNDAIAE